MRIGGLPDGQRSKSLIRVRFKTQAPDTPGPERPQTLKFGHKESPVVPGRQRDLVLSDQISVGVP